MSKATKNERIAQLEQIAADQARAFKIMADRLKSIEVESKWIIHMTGIEISQLKQLDQSVFDGLDEKWRFAAVDRGGLLKAFICKPKLSVSMTSFILLIGNTIDIGTGYDASNWQNSLIERDIAKELLEVDLSSELTGSGLCRAMINRGDKIVLCIVRDYEHENDIYYDAITYCSGDYFDSTLSSWRYAVPINNQGEPLTQAEAGL